MKWLVSVLVALVMLVGVVGFFSGASVLSVLRKPAVDRAETWYAERVEFESRFEGFVVWESRRGDRWQLRRYGAAWNPLSWRWVKESDRWRLWICKLDGSAPRPLTSQDSERDHFAPHISPDGKCVAYLSYPAGKNGYMPPGDGWAAELRLLHLSSGRDEMLVPAARTFGEHRSAMWIDVASLAYVAGDGETRVMDLKNGESRPLLNWNSRAAGMDFEYGWLPNPSLEYATTGRPRFAEMKAGRTMTRPRTAVRNGCQPYFTSDGIWGYFMEWAGGPRISRVHLATRTVTPLTKVNDDRLPETKNYTYFPMVSRNQAVMAFAASSGGHDHFREDYDIFLVPVNPANLQWQSRPVRYTFHPQTDRYPDVFIESASDDRPAAEVDPEIFTARDDAGVIILGATVALDPASLRANAEFPVETGEVFALRNGRELRVTLNHSEDADGVVHLNVDTLDGIALPTHEVRVGATKWPVSAEGLVFHFRHNDIEPQDFMDRSGAAMWDSNGAMQLRGGAFTARRADAEPLPSRAGPLSLEFAIRGYESSTPAARTIFTLGDEVRFYQEGRTAMLEFEGSPAFALFDVDPRLPEHIVLSIGENSLEVFVNGESVATYDIPNGLLQGKGAWKFGGGWNGSVEQVAFYQRLLTNDEIRLASARLRESMDPRSTTPRNVVQARLGERSPTPTLESISPYRDALASFEAEVIEVLEGNDLPVEKLFRFIAPVILDGTATGLATAKSGDHVELLLEPLEMNQQTEEIFVADDLEIATDLPEYFTLYERLESAVDSE